MWGFESFKLQLSNFETFDFLNLVMTMKKKLQPFLLDDLQDIPISATFNDWRASCYFTGVAAIGHLAQYEYPILQKYSTALSWIRPCARQQGQLALWDQRTSTLVQIEVDISKKFTLYHLKIAILKSKPSKIFQKKLKKKFLDVVWQCWKYLEASPDQGEHFFSLGFLIRSL